MKDELFRSAAATAADPIMQRRKRETFSSLAMEIDDGNGTTSLSSGSSFVPAGDDDDNRSDEGWMGGGRQIQRQFLY